MGEGVSVFEFQVFLGLREKTESNRAMQSIEITICRRGASRPK